VARFLTGAASYREFAPTIEPHARLKSPESGRVAVSGAGRDNAPLDRPPSRPYCRAPRLHPLVRFLFSPRITSVPIWVALLAAIGANWGAVAAAGELESAAVRIGFDGRFKVGRWTECRVETTAPFFVGSRLVVRAPDPDGHVVSYPGPPAAEGARVLVAHFMSGRLDAMLADGAALELVLETPGGEPQRRAVLPRDVRPLREGVPLIATVGDPAGLDPDTTGSSAAQRRRQVVPLASLADLPTTQYGFDGLDVLVVAGNYTIDVERLNALERWVWEGGHLVLAAGASVGEYRESALRTAAWITFDVAAEPFQVRELDKLVAFAERNSPIPIFGTVPVARISVRRGEVLASIGNDPLVARAIHGFGHVTLLAVDLNRAPLTEWEAGIDDLVRRLVQVGRDGGQRASSSSDRRLAHSGIGDLASQLNAAQEEFDDVRRSSRWVVMGLVLLYLALIGPLDYWFVHRVLQRPEWTWATFPAVVVLAALLGIVTASASNGRTLQVNRFELVDVDVETDAMRGLGLVTLYSPEHRRYAVEGTPRSPVPSTPVDEDGRLGWSGLPEDSYGGMYRQGGLRFHQLEYAHADDAGAFENVPIPVWSTKAFRIRWNAPAGGVARDRLVEFEHGRLGGTLRHDLAGPIENWLVAYRSRIYRPTEVDGTRPPLRPGETWQIDGATTEPRDLRVYMTNTTFRTIAGRTEIDDRSVPRQSAYDALARDPRALIEMLTLHAAAGGSGYTGLENAPFGRFDLSNLVAADRAVLIGRLAEPTVDVTVNGNPATAGRRDTFVRIVFRVDPFRPDP
jgi:hypothetical protein